MFAHLLLVVVLLNIVTAEKEAIFGPCINNICPDGSICQQGDCVVSEEAADQIEAKGAEPVKVEQE